MELSDAIKAGAKLHPQAFGLLVTRRKGEIVATCALGAALQAAGCSVDHLTETFPLLASGKLWPEPPCGCFPVGHLAATVDMLITHLNDDHRWTRERIAAWVRHLERKGVGE